MNESQNKSQNELQTQACIKLIEKETEEKIKKISGNPDASTILQSIMKEGSDTFVEKIGRPMTYSEIRQMYG